jgi:hypothetical protein
VPLLRATQIPPRHGGATRSEPPQHAGAVRTMLAAFGGFLVLIGIWLLGAELLRRAPSQFAWNSEQAAPAAAGSAGAGHVGLIRGDVWLDDGIASWSVFLAQGNGGAQNTAKDAASFAAARSALVRAARLAPHDARAWLVLAAAESRAGTSPDMVAAALKMAYYTGSNEAALMPLRIGLAAQPNLGDAELRILLENEIRTIAQQASLRPVLAQAYRHASPDAQRTLREVVGTIDAGLASDMQANPAKR